MTVTVGFAPATTPGLVTGGTAATPEDGAPEGLFAALLAMLSSGTLTQATVDAIDAETPDNISSTDFASLVEALKVEATSAPEESVADPGTDEDQSPETSPLAGLDQLINTPEGKSLLKDLGDALIALNEALEAGQPVDPALEKKLNDTLDAAAVYLGTVTPAAPIDPRITALAIGEALLPAAALAPEAAAPNPADEATTQPIAAAPVAEPLLAGPPAEPPASKSDVTTLDEAPQALRQLGLHIGKLVDKLAEQDPELAKKLAAIADGLKSPSTSGDTTKPRIIDESASAEITRIVAALSETKPKTVTQTPRPFTAPALEMPEVVATTKQAQATEPATPAEPPPADTLEAPEPKADIARPAITTRSAPEAKPDDPAPKPVADTSASAATPAADLSSAAPTTQAAAPQATRTIHAAYQTPVQQVNLPQVAFEVVRQFDAGNSRFQIRLDPPELGRIDVKLDVDKSGTVNARMTVERPETLDLMQRDQRALQQALQQAGLDASKTNLEFSLRQNPFAQQGGMNDGRNGQPSFAGGGVAATDEAAASELATTTYRSTASAGGVNLFV